MNRSTFEEKTFFQTLFDFSFTSFITLRFLKVIYVIAMVAIGIGALGIIISASRGGVGGFIAGLIAAVVIGGIYLIVTRIWLELIALFFRISENAATTAETLSRLVNDEPAPVTAPAPEATAPVYAAPVQPAAPVQAVAPVAQPPAVPVYAPPAPTYAPPVAPAEPRPPAMAPPPEPPRAATPPPPPNPYGLQPPPPPPPAAPPAP